MRRFFKALAIGIKRRWRIALTHGLAVVGAIWLVTEVVTRAYAPANDWLDLNGNLYLWLVAAAAALGFLIHAYEPSHVRFSVPTTNSKISLKFGDLFAAHSDLVIGVNEFFDTEVGLLVAKESLHGQLIQREYNGDQIRFRNDIEAQLATKQGTTIARTGTSRTLAFQIGTTIVLQLGGRNVFLVALARSDPHTGKASCDLPDYWCALQGVLDAIHHYGNGAPVTFPLLGGGRSGLNIEPQHLLRFLTLGLVEYGRRKGLPERTAVALPDACFEELDLREIARDWSRR